MNYSPEKRKQLEDLRDAISAALEGKPVQALDCNNPGEGWKNAEWTFSNFGMLLYRPTPTQEKVWY